jgi:hypothetical protein
VWLAFTVSGRVVPIAFRSRRTKMISSPPEKTTPKTGYQSKMKSLKEVASMAVYDLSGPAHLSATEAPG